MTWKCLSNGHSKQLFYMNSKEGVLINHLTFTTKDGYLQAVFYINKNASNYSKFNKSLGLFGFALDIEESGRYVINLGDYEKAQRLFKLFHQFVPFSQSEVADVDAFFTERFKHLNRGIPVVLSFAAPSHLVIVQWLLQQKKPLDPPLPPAQNENSLSLIQQAQLLVSGSYERDVAKYNRPVSSNSAEEQSKVESSVSDRNASERKTAYRR